MRRPLLASLSLLAAALLPGAAVVHACPGGQAAPGARPEREPSSSAEARAFRIASLDDEDDDGPVIAGAASPAAEEANRRFEAQRWEDAALAARRVAAGMTGDDEGNRQIARYHEAVSLFHLGFPEASLAIFSTIAERRAHPRFAQVLRFVAQIAEGREEQDRFAALIGNYDEAAIASLDTPRDRALHDRARYLQGIARARLRDHEQVVSALDKVSRESPLFLHARFRAGLAFIALRKTVPAVKAFLQMAEAAGDEEPRLRDLAWISMARAYYSGNHYLDEACAPTIDATRLSAAMKYWNKITPDSPLWPDALLESSWGYFMAGDYPHALGNLQVFESGYLPAALSPEAEILRGIIHFTVCHYDDAATVVAHLQRRHQPLREALTVLIAEFAGDAQDDAVLDHYDDLRAGRARLPTILRPFGEAVRKDRRASRERLRQRAIDEEEARLGSSPERLRSSALGGEMREALRLARRAAIHDLAARVRTLYHDRLDEIDRRLLDGRKLIIDVVQARGQEKLRARWPSVSHGRPEYGAIVPDVEHEIWPFDGEYWRDELGTYRHFVDSYCHNH